ncbi:uncharacterized protein E5676_scaffold177G00220 [Cucumis melo var. makuwa]|uniref:Uncharacterized protein n=1 Tax=Cucumis melo var. makuwa TaxID=1194695 RepID=A0A5D3CKP3_CUCMM|nr:uncharacterized protein E5676_scaffold177G00220 [Cucumis melo var. makuwa]
MIVTLAAVCLVTVAPLHNAVILPFLEEETEEYRLEDEMSRNVRILNGWSNKSFVMLLEFLRAVFPMCSSFMGHRSYLPKNHMWRRSRLHDGKVERRAPPIVTNGYEILKHLDQLEFPVMGKTKDTMNARLDLQDLKIRKDLHLIEVGNQLFKPHMATC